jgi:hypothetical protein
MESKRYRVETQTSRLATWIPVHHTDDLAIARKHMAAIAEAREVWAVRLIDQTAQHILHYERALNSWRQS